jgi:TPR repeat protein
MGITQVQTLALFEADDPWEFACKSGEKAGCAHHASFQIDNLADNDDDAPPKGFATLDQLCTGGMPWACAEAGRAASKGLGTTKDDAKAKAYFAKACSGGFKPACGK